MLDPGRTFFQLPTGQLWADAGGLRAGGQSNFGRVGNFLGSGAGKGFLGTGRREKPRNRGQYLRGTMIPVGRMGCPGRRRENPWTTEGTPDPAQHAASTPPGADGVSRVGVGQEVYSQVIFVDEYQHQQRGFIVKLWVFRQCRQQYQLGTHLHLGTQHPFR